MKSRYILLLVLISFLSLPANSQTANQAASDTALLGLPGDNLDLYAVLNIFQKSKTIEEFEKTLNMKETGINNLDLNLNDTVDFIKVVTKQDKNDFTFVLQIDISKKEIQDVAVILVSKDKDGKVTMQIVGDENLYGKNYVIEPKPSVPAATANPAYTGTDPVATTVTTTAPATTTVVVVESAPIVQYVYSPVYVPYYPPYYYHYYPPYYNPYKVMAVSVYHHNNYYHHGGYHGGHGNTVVVHNTNNYNNYNNSRNTSNTVNNNKNNGNYNNNNASNSNRPSTTSSSSNRSSTSKSKASSSSAKTSTSQSGRSSTSAKSSTTQSKGTSSTSGSGRRSGGGRRR